MRPEQLNGFGSEIFRSVSLSIVFIGAAVAIVCFVKPWWRWLAVVVQLCFAAFFIVQGVHAYLDRTRPEIVSTEGEAVFSGGYRHSVLVKIGSKTFTFPERTNGQDTQSLFPRDHRYRFYFLRYSGKQLSVESARWRALGNRQGGRRRAAP